MKFLSKDLSRRDLLAMLLTVGGAMSLTAFLPADGRIVPKSKVSRRVPPRGGFRGNYFPDVTLKTQNGEKVRFYTDLLKDKIAVINFMYVHCEKLCPRQTANLVEVQKELGDIARRNIHFYS